MKLKTRAARIIKYCSSQYFKQKQRKKMHCFVTTGLVCAGCLGCWQVQNEQCVTWLWEFKLVQNPEDQLRNPKKIWLPSSHLISGPLTKKQCWRLSFQVTPTRKFLLPLEVTVTADVGLHPPPAVQRSHAQHKQLPPAGQRGSDRWPHQCAFAVKRVDRKKNKQSLKAQNLRRFKLVSEGSLCFVRETRYRTSLFCNALI